MFLCPFWKLRFFTTSIQLYMCFLYFKRYTVAFKMSQFSKVNNICILDLIGCDFTLVQVWQTPEGDQLFIRCQRQPDSSHQADSHLPQAAAEIHQNLALYPEVLFFVFRMHISHMLAHIPRYFDCNGGLDCQLFDQCKQVVIYWVWRQDAATGLLEIVAYTKAHLRESLIPSKYCRGVSAFAFAYVCVNACYSCIRSVKDLWNHFLILLKNRSIIGEWVAKVSIFLHILHFTVSRPMVKDVTCKWNSNYNFLF